jgi:hypothetical protein
VTEVTVSGTPALFIYGKFRSMTPTKVLKLLAVCLICIALAFGVVWVAERIF